MGRAIIFPGTFDPITFGHIDLIKRCLKNFDRVIVAVAHNENKKPLFSVEERVALIKESIPKNDSIEIDHFKVLLVDYSKKKEISTIVRGLRAISDFEFEFQMALTNRKINEDIETIFMMPHEQFSYVSSRMIKEISRLGGDVSKFVPEPVAKALKSKF